MIVRGEWKLIHFFEDNSYKLYRPGKDFSEAKDLSSDFPEVAASLKAELMKWQQETEVVIPTEQNEKFNSSAKETKKKK